MASTRSDTIDIANPGARAWFVVAMLWLVAMVNYLDRLMIVTMRDPIVASLGITDEQFGLLTSVFLWVYAVLSPLGGYLADRFSRRTVIIGSLLVWSVVTWLTGHAQSYGQLFVARGLMGISEACYIPAALALIADYHRGPTRSLAVGLHISGIYAGMVLGGMGGYCAECFGWRFGFTAAGAFGVGYAVVLLFCLKDATQDRTAGAACEGKVERRVAFPTAVVALFGQLAFWLLMGSTALFGLAGWAVAGWLPTYLRERFHLGLGDAGISAMGYVQAAAFVGVVVGGAWADRWSRRNCRARALVPALGHCAAAPCLFLAATTDELPIAILGLMMYGLSRGFYDANLMPVLRQVTDERFSATGYGFLNFVSCAVGGLMIWLGGALRDAQVDLGRVFQVSAAGLLLIALLLAAVRVRQNA